MNNEKSQPREQAGIDLDKLRAGFEKRYGPRDSFAWLTADGKYKIPSLQSAWEIYQAAAEDVRQAAPEAPDSEQQAGATDDPMGDRWHSLTCDGTCSPPCSAATTASTQEQLEEALACVLSEHTNLSTDGIDDFVPRLVAAIPAAALPFNIVPTEGIDPALYERTSPVSASIEPVEHQYRTRPTWRTEGEGWTEWAKCSKESYGDYIKTPINHDWQYEARALYSGGATAPSSNADWQSGYKTGYETGLSDGRAEFTNPAATSPAERAALAQQGAAQAIPKGDSFKPVYWFSILTKCARLLDLPTDEPIPSGVLRAVEELVAAQAAHAGADTELDAARYRVLRCHVAPREVCFSMDVPVTEIPPEQSIEERIDELCDAAMSAATEQESK